MRSRILKIGALLVPLLVLASGCRKSPSEPEPAETAIEGRVLHAELGTPIDSARVHCEPHFHIDSTDAEGRFHIGNLVAGNYLVIAEKRGFHNDTAAVTLEEGQTAGVELHLRPKLNLKLWEFLTDAPVYYSTPAIGDDGTIYFGTGVYIGTTSGSLYALNPDGTLKWSVRLENNVTTPVIGNDGTIYVMDRRNVLYAFQPDGTQKWKYDAWEVQDFAEVGQRPVAEGADGTLYTYVGGRIYALTPDGRRIWMFDPPYPGGTPCGASLVVGSDGTIYGIPGGDVLYAIRPDGTMKWAFYLQERDEHSFSSPSLDAGNVVYVVTENLDGGYVYAVQPDGVLKWRVTAGHHRAVRASPAIGADGTVYVGTKAYSAAEPAEFLAINPDGSIKWRFTVETVHWTPDDVYSSPTIGADGLIYFGAETGYLYALNPDGTLNWKQELEIGINWCSPTLLNDGTLYVGGTRGTAGALVAIRTTSHGLAASAWPTFRGNNKNTGRLSR